MADAFQAQLDGDEIVITCDDEWGCCQRKQARAKVRAMNKAIQDKGGASTVKPNMNTMMVPDPLRGGTISVADITTRSRKRAADARRRMSDDEKQADTEERGAHPCLVEELQGSKPPETENDHPLDVKLCGNWDAPLVPTDAVVNNAFGKVAENAPANKTIRKIVLVCPKGGKCKDESHNTGKPSNPKTKRPDPYVQGRGGSGAIRPSY